MFIEIDLEEIVSAPEERNVPNDKTLRSSRAFRFLCVPDSINISSLRD